jgi:hypothetical protein
MSTLSDCISPSGAVHIVYPENRYVSQQVIKTWAQDAYFDNGSDGECPTALLDCMRYLSDLGDVTFAAAR